MLAQNLDDVLSFVAETLKKDEKQVFRLADYANGIVYHEADLHGIDGLELNVSERSGTISWLKIARRNGRAATEISSFGWHRRQRHEPDLGK